MRILLVDDDNALMESLAAQLIQQRYAVDIAADGDTAKTYIDLFNYDLIVLDLMLPDGDGIEFCRRFRASGYGNPLMILSAKENTEQKVKALDAGADDYVVKPFDFDELCARIRALLRRENQGLPTVLAWGALKLDPSTCETTYHDVAIRLTPKEFSLMELFLRNPSRVYSLSAIIDDLWSFEAPPGEDAVRTHIKGLRRKLKTAGAPKDLIKTVYGLGYRLNESAYQPERRSEQTLKQTSEQTLEQTLEHPLELREQLAQACRRYLRTASRQIAALEKATAKFATAAEAQHSIDPELYQESHVNAHKLAGSLGSYGIPAGSKTAAKIEAQLQEGTLPFVMTVPVAVQLKYWTGQLRQQIDQATVQAVIEATSVAIKESTPLVLVVSAERQFVQQLEEQAEVTQLRVQALASTEQAIRLFNRCAIDATADTTTDTSTGTTEDVLVALPDLVVIDVGVDGDTAGSQAKPNVEKVRSLVTAIKQNHPAPVMVLGQQIPLEHRLKLIKQGVEVVTDRAIVASQIMTIATELVTAETSQIRIAITDDDTQLLSLLKSSLAPWGFQVTTFTSANKLWTWLNTQNTIAPDTRTHQTSAVDMIVLDVAMPGIDGIEICQVIRADARFQSVPILFLSQYQEDALRIKAFQSGADDFIDKAIAPIELATRLRNQLARACRLQSTPHQTTPHPIEPSQIKPNWADNSPIPAQTSP